MIPPCATAGFDFTEITTTTNPNYQEAVNTCKTCPMRVECARFSIARDVAGLAAGMLAHQRDQARGSPPQAEAFLDLFPAEVITAGLLDEAIDYTDQRIPESMTRVIDYWTCRGELPKQILKRLPNVDINGYDLELNYGTPLYTERTITWVRDRQRPTETWRDSGYHTARHVPENDLQRAYSSP